MHVFLSSHCHAETHCSVLKQSTGAKEPQSSKLRRDSDCRSSRRSVLLLGVLSTTGSLRSSANASPYSEAANIQYGLVNGNIRPCPGGYNPNCVSTASLNDLYSPVWRSSDSSPQTSAQILDNAVRQTCGNAQLVSRKSTLDGEYLEYEVPGLFGKDFMEFLVKPDRGAGGRNTDSRDAALVLFRSIAGSVRYLYPFQTPISDFGAQRKRIEAIRQTLGWRKVGCELKECFE